MNKIMMIFIIFLQFTGCSHTVKSWNNSPVEEYYGVLGDDTLPQTLSDKNVTFSCKDMIYSSEGYTKKCYVKKNTAQNIDSWGKKILRTSLTAVGETIENIVILGFYIILGTAQSNSSQ